MSHEVVSPRKFWGDEEFIPFCRPSLSPEAIQEVVRCLESGWITTGPRVQQFEADIAAYVSAPYALTLTSATAGLYLALRALDIGSGDEIITTPLTFAATVNVIALLGATPVFVDINLATYNIDVAKIEERITSRTKAIIPVHFAGLSVDMNPLLDIAKRYNLRVIEDAAHAIGTTYQGKRIGSFGDIQVFSFHATKNMTTGEGGALVTRDPDLAKCISVLRFHGIDKPAWDRFSKKGSPHYDVVAPAIKFNMMDIQAALGIHQLRDLEGFIQRRRVLAQRYMDRLRTRDYLILPPGENEIGHSWHIFCPLVRETRLGMPRDALINALKARNIGTSLHYRPVHLFTCYQRDYGFKVGDYPAAEAVGRCVISLPLFPGLSFEDQDRVIQALDEIAHESRP